MRSEDPTLRALSPRQRAVLELVAKGLTNQEIGGVLGISGETVRTHVAAVLARLDVSNRAEAVARFMAWQAEPRPIGELLARPAIAVLPVLALDADARATTVAAGITLDLVNLFSRWCWFPVIANTSTRDARALGPTSREIGALLGARFLVDGRLRAGRGQWRFTVAIAEAESGHCLWTDTCDFPEASLFEVHDAVAQSIVAAAYPRLIASVQAGLGPSRHPSDVDGWVLAQRAFLDHAARERDANARAQIGFRAALEREPALVLAHYGLGLATYDEILNQWGPLSSARERLAACAARCIEIAPDLGEGHYLLGRYFQTGGAFEQSMQPLRDAIARNPSFAEAHAVLAQVLLVAGHFDEGLARMNHACRLGPRSFVAGLAFAHFLRGDYPEARRATDRALATNPRYPFLLAVGAAAAWWLGDTATAAAHVYTLDAVQPGFDVRRFLRTFGSHVEAMANMMTALDALRARR